MSPRHTHSPVAQMVVPDAQVASEAMPARLRTVPLPEVALVSCQQSCRRLRLCAAILMLPPFHHLHLRAFG
jgi:hypothetical protein